MNIKQLLDSESVSKLKSYRKILVLGAPGAGKSYLSKKLASSLNLPLYHLDQKFWSTKWTPIESDDFRKYCSDIVQEDSFLMDGNYGTTFDIRWPGADLVIFVDTNPWICIYRQICRVIKDRLGSLDRSDRPANQRERFNLQLFWFTIKFRDSHGHLIDCRMRELYPDIAYIRLGN